METQTHSACVRRDAEGGLSVPPPYEARLLGDALDLLEGIVQWLVKLRQELIAEGQLPAEAGADMHAHRGYATLAAFWHHLLEAIVSGCFDWNPEVRQPAEKVFVCKQQVGSVRFDDSST